MARRTIESNIYVYVLVAHEGRFLLVQERKHGQLWYGPAGGHEPGESIGDAAVRETMEEAGVQVAPVGIVRVDQQWFSKEDGLRGWWRFVLLARPVSSIDPKHHADHHSLGARWFHPREVPLLPLRHPEVVDLMNLALTAPPRIQLAPGGRVAWQHDHELRD